MSRGLTVFQGYFKANEIAGSSDYTKILYGKYLRSLNIMFIKIKKSHCGILMFVYLAGQLYTKSA